MGALASADPELAEDVALVVVGLMRRQSNNIEGHGKRARSAVKEEVVCDELAVVCA